MIGCLLWMAAAIAAPQDEPRADKVVLRVAGVCLDDSGGPVADAVVRLWRTDLDEVERLFETKSDVDGKFDFEQAVSSPPKSAQFWLVATMEQHAPAARAIGLRRQPEEPLKLTLAKGPVALRGKVLGPDDQPLQGARVHLPGGPPHEVGVRSAKTGADGRFVIADADPFAAYAKQFTEFKVTSRWLYAEHPDLGSTHIDVTSEPGELLFHFEKPCYVEGRVIEKKTGKAAAGVDVWMQGVKRSTWWQTTTDADGRYRMPSQVAEPFNICLADTSKWTAVAIASFPAEAGRTATAPDLELIEGGWIEGVVVDGSTGKPLQLKEGETLDVGLYGPSRPQPGAAIESTPVGRDGAFRMRVAPGSNRLYIPRMEIRGSVTVDVAEGETVKTKIRATREQR